MQKNMDKKILTILRRIFVYLNLCTTKLNSTHVVLFADTGGFGQIANMTWLFWLLSVAGSWYFLNFPKYSVNQDQTALYWSDLSLQ